MNLPLDKICRARIPTSALASMAGLRRFPGISVIQAGDVAWVTWPEGEDRVLRAILPFDGIELFEQRQGEWFRPGERLPSFDGPPNFPDIALDRAITPVPFAAERSGSPGPKPARFRLAPSNHPRITSATLCSLSRLGRWAEEATTADLESIRGSISGDMALLVGEKLPIFSDASRFWGAKILVPLGFEPWPRLPEVVARELLGASEGDLILLGGEGPVATSEVIPAASFRAMTRAGVRLANGGHRHEP